MEDQHSDSQLDIYLAFFVFLICLLFALAYRYEGTADLFTGQ